MATVTDNRAITRKTRRSYGRYLAWSLAFSASAALSIYIRSQKIIHAWTQDLQAATHAVRGDVATGILEDDSDNGEEAQAASFKFGDDTKLNITASVIIKAGGNSYSGDVVDPHKLVMAMEAATRDHVREIAHPTVKDRLFVCLGGDIGRTDAYRKSVEPCRKHCIWRSAKETHNIIYLIHSNASKGCHGEKS